MAAANRHPQAIKMLFTYQNSPTGVNPNMLATLCGDEAALASLSESEKGIALVFAAKISSYHVFKIIYTKAGIAFPNDTIEEALQGAFQNGQLPIVGFILDEVLPTIHWMAIVACVENSQHHLIDFYWDNISLHFTPTLKCALLDRITWLILDAPNELLPCYTWLKLFQRLVNELPANSTFQFDLTRYITLFLSALSDKTIIPEFRLKLMEILNQIGLAIKDKSEFAKGMCVCEPMMLENMLKSLQISREFIEKLLEGAKAMDASIIKNKDQWDFPLCKEVLAEHEEVQRTFICQFSQLSVSTQRIDADLPDNSAPQASPRQ